MKYWQKMTLVVVAIIDMGLLAACLASVLTGRL
jgi:hypothetical protein